MNIKNIYGMLNADGSIKSWPEADLNGREVVRENATRAQVDSTRFVVVPVNVEYTQQLKEALQSGYDGLLKWRNEVAAPPAVGFTPMDEEPTPPLTTLSAPPVETFNRKRGGSEVDNS